MDDEAVTTTDVDGDDGDAVRDAMAIVKTRARATTGLDDVGRVMVDFWSVLVGLFGLVN